MHVVVAHHERGERGGDQRGVREKNLVGDIGDPLEQPFAAVGVQASHVCDRRITRGVHQCVRRRSVPGHDGGAAPRDHARPRRRGAARNAAARPRLPVNRDRPDVPHRPRAPSSRRDQHQSLVGGHERDPPPVGREGRRASPRQPLRVVVAHADDDNPTSLNGRDAVTPRRPRGLATPGEPAEPTRAPGPQRAITNRGKLPGRRPYRVGHATDRRGRLAQRVDPIHGHATALAERDQRAARLESRVGGGAEAAIHARPVRVHDPDRGRGIHDRPAIGRPARPARRAAPRFDRADPAHDMPVRAHQQDPAPGHRLHGQQAVRPWKGSQRRRGEQQPQHDHGAPDDTSPSFHVTRLS